MEKVQIEELVLCGVSFLTRVIVSCHSFTQFGYFLWLITIKLETIRIKSIGVMILISSNAYGKW
jgi:hypothetical protein